ncbi:type II toxin-antitoxin system Phd/YefM family antitoxin [Candidatus Poribacteria bacterium]|nr:type II toxin-antitoxin system Phd/YefM family antitoxin [Candidatus Poribacteria bacterium]
MLFPIYSLSELKKSSTKFLSRLQECPVIITQRGRPKGVIVDYEEFLQMYKWWQIFEKIEMELDEKRLEEAIAQGGEPIPFEEFVADYEHRHGVKISLRKEEKNV